MWRHLRVWASFPGHVSAGLLGHQAGGEPGNGAAGIEGLHAALLHRAVHQHLPGLLVTLQWALVMVTTSHDDSLHSKYQLPLWCHSSMCSTSSSAPCHSPTLGSSWPLWSWLSDTPPWARTDTPRSRHTSLHLLFRIWAHRHRPLDLD